ncbi:class I SAM-dependent methyltransferase [Henriciella aquimarina]|uniref:class I SAM-dependent methyltransferase n=1 Tax=Henriciella aquimarina TaxID=545261 RepID=UPI001301A5E8|nr:class I SAM-dependent methyltransferase [Henriciella aquimarina]
MRGPVSDHYNRPDLLAQVERALGAAGKSPETVTSEDLAPIEEFHMGARAATIALMPGLKLDETMRALDVGCGTGGVARYAAERYGCKVDGVDLTGSFIEAGKTITSWLKLTSKVTLHRESALHTPFKDETFDAAWMFHVAMNIEDKRSLFAEVFRVLKPGARFLVYDVMRGEDAETPLTFPVPWASDASTSFVRPAERYEEHLEAAGFAIEKAQPRHDIADRFFEAMEARAGQPKSPMSLALVMGETAKEKAANLKKNYQAGLIVPTAILCRKPE